MSLRLEALRSACRDFERELAGTTSVEEALAVRARSCTRLEEKCHSDTVRRLLEQHAQRMIRERYPAQP